jgi:hypothetical protein
MRQRRQRYLPSSSNKIAEITKLHGCSSPHLRSLIAPFVGSFVTADWAIEQVSRKPHFVIGWPKPCKAALMSMGKAARA